MDTENPILLKANRDYMKALLGSGTSLLDMQGHVNFYLADVIFYISLCNDKKDVKEELEVLKVLSGKTQLSIAGFRIASIDAQLSYLNTAKQIITMTGLKDLLCARPWFLIESILEMPVGPPNIEQCREQIFDNAKELREMLVYYKDWERNLKDQQQQQMNGCKLEENQVKGANQLNDQTEMDVDGLENKESKEMHFESLSKWLAYAKSKMDEIYRDGYMECDLDSKISYIKAKLSYFRTAKEIITMPGLEDMLNSGPQTIDTLILENPLSPEQIERFLEHIYHKITDLKSSLWYHTGERALMKLPAGYPCENQLTNRRQLEENQPEEQEQPEMDASELEHKEFEERRLKFLIKQLASASSKMNEIFCGDYPDLRVAPIEAELLYLHTAKEIITMRGLIDMLSRGLGILTNKWALENIACPKKIESCLGSINRNVTELSESLGNTNPWEKELEDKEGEERCYESLSKITSAKSKMEVIRYDDVVLDMDFKVVRLINVCENRIRRLSEEDNEETLDQKIRKRPRDLLLDVE